MIDFKTKRGFICDMDGVLYHGNKLLPGATEFIQWLQAYNKEYLFLTNNSGFTPRELHIKLLRMGIDVSEEHFYTSALATAEFIRSQNPKASAYVLGEAGLLNALYDAGIAISEYSDAGNKSCSRRCETDRSEFRCIRTHRKRNRTCMSRFDFSD